MRDQNKIYAWLNIFIKSNSTYTSFITCENKLNDIVIKIEFCLSPLSDLCIFKTYKHSIWNECDSIIKSTLWESHYIWIKFVWILKRLKASVYQNMTCKLLVSQGL